MTSNTKILKQTVELLTGELKQVGEYRDNAVRCGVELNKQLAAMTARADLADRQVALLCGHIDDYGSCCLCPAKSLGADCSHSGELCREQLAAWSRAKAVKERGKG